MSSNSVGSIVIDTKLDNKDFMSNKEDLARAIQFLQGTVTQMGKDLKSSVGGYGTAMIQSVRASREFSANMRQLSARAQELNAKMDELKNKKIATWEFKERRCGY